MNFFEKRKIRKQLHALLHHARTLKASREDLMNAGELAFLGEHLGQADAAYRGGDAAAMEQAGSALEACVSKLSPPKPLAGWRENFDVLVVAISVAMAFRAYFYQPFKIPTGSMQPTLYGIHSERAEPTLMDRLPLKVGKWLVTGSWYREIRVRAKGQVIRMANGVKPGFTTFTVKGEPYYVPNDVADSVVCRPDPEAGRLAANGLGRVIGCVNAGEVLWAGQVTAGDFVFVNRWKWNFCHPARGEVMVFSTTGIMALQQGTHYIKRMMGLPNETLQVKAPNLLVNGAPVSEPPRVGQIARREQIAPWAPAYAGFNPAGPLTEEHVVRLAGDQYFAMGDNSHNSLDSRFWGPVPERNLLGPATVVYWPFTSPRLGRIR